MTNNEIIFETVRNTFTPAQLAELVQSTYTAEQIAARRAAVQCLRLRSAHKFQLPGLRLPHNDCPLGSVHSFSSCSTGGSSTTPHSVPSSSVP